MSDPITRCPSCLVAFRVSHAQLRAANGMVRCGACLNIFNAREHFTDAPAPDSLHAPQPAASQPVRIEQSAPQTTDHLTDMDGKTMKMETDGEPKTTNADSLIDDSLDLTSQETGQAPDLHTERKNEIDTPASNAISTEPQSEESPNIPQGDIPQGDIPQGGIPQGDTPQPEIQREDPIDIDILEDSLTLDELEPGQPKIDFPLNSIPDIEEPSPKPAKRVLAGLWWALSTLALAALGIQYLHFNSDQLARDPESRPWIKNLCAITGCKLPPLAERSQIESTNLVVRSHPENPGAMLVDIVIVNQAPVAQAFPDLLLSFQNMDGETVALRQFKPREYLRGELAGAIYMPSRQPVRLELEIVDPGEDAVSYRLGIP